MILELNEKKIQTLSWLAEVALWTRFFIIKVFIEPPVKHIGIRITKGHSPYHVNYCMSRK